MPKADLRYLGHMFDCGRRVEQFLAGKSRADYDSDEVLRLAVIHADCIAVCWTPTDRRGYTCNMSPQTHASPVAACSKSDRRVLVAGWFSFGEKKGAGGLFKNLFGT